MAMTLDPPDRQDQTPKAAVAALHAHADQRWVEISDRVVARSLRVTRPSLPVRAASTGGAVNVSEQVLIAAVRQSLDDLTDATVVGIQINTDQHSRYAGVQITITARYGSPILPVADLIREQARHALSTLLGPVTPTVSVHTMHIHVGDVKTTASTAGATVQ